MSPVTMGPCSAIISPGPYLAGGRRASAGHRVSQWRGLWETLRYGMLQARAAVQERRRNTPAPVLQRAWSGRHSSGSATRCANEACACASCVIGQLQQMSRLVSAPLTKRAIPFARSMTPLFSGPLLRERCITEESRTTTRETMLEISPSELLQLHRYVV